MHRLRDLDRRGRIGALVLALLLVAIPFVAAAVNHGRWIPQGDDALIELRARDVGTGRMPLVGQPSTSGSYGQQAENVAHPGPIEFVALAGPIRLLGPTTGFLLTTAAVGAACLVLAAYAVFRQCGPRGGSAAALLLGLAAFTAGAGGVVEPISSNAGRLPLLAAAVLAWAVLCGDLRLLPVTAAVWSYAAQQHLSVLPACAVVLGVAVVGVGWWFWRPPVDPDPDRDRDLDLDPEPTSEPGGDTAVDPVARARREGLVWSGLAAVVGVVLWLPVLWQQATGDPGNLSALASYSGDESRESLGLRSAFGQVAHVLGVPPFLGRSGQRGWDVIAHVSTPQVVLTFLVVGAVLAVGTWWARADRRLVAATAVLAALVVAGLATGTNIPDSPEKGRLAFYHWAFALSFFELLIVGWLLAKLAPIVLPRLTHGRRGTAFAVAAVVLLGVLLVPVVVDRPSDRLLQPLPTASVQRLVDQVTGRPAVTGPSGPLLVLVDGDDRYIQAGDTLAVRLVAHGIDARLPPSSAGFAHPDHLLDPCRARRALVLSLVLGPEPAVPGRRVASVDAAPWLDRAALDRLVRSATGAHVEFGPDLTAALGRLPGDQGDLIGATLAFRLGEEPLRVLLVRSNLELLLAHPPASPALDPDDLRDLLRSLPEGTATVPATRLEARLLDRAELRRFRPDLTQDC